MSYVNNNLMPNEVVRFRGQVHWVVFLPAIFWTAMGLIAYLLFSQLALCGVLIFIAFVRFARGLIYFFTTELAVTDQRIISKFGLIARVTFELPLDRVTTLNVNQTILGRALNYGDIQIHAMGGVATPIPVIADPLRFRQWVLGEVELVNRIPS